MSGLPYPIALRLEGRPVLIVGGGAVGARKAEGLLEAGAQVMAVSLAFSGEWDGMNVARLLAPYASGHMESHAFVLAFAATDSGAVNARVQADATARGIWCCRCDDARASDFAGMATARVGGITIAVSTASGSPTVAGQVRDRLAGQVDAAWAVLAEHLPAWRERVKGVADGPARRELLRRMASDDMLEAIRIGGAAAGQRLLDSWLGAGGASGGHVQ